MRQLLARLVGWWNRYEWAGGSAVIGLACLILAPFEAVMAAAAAVMDEQSETRLSFRPARALFFESLHRQSNSYQLIASLPTAQDLLDMDERAEGFPAFAGETLASVRPRLNWIGWSGERHGIALGSSIAHEEERVGHAEILTPLAISFFYQPNRLIFVPSYQYGVTRQDVSGVAESTAGYLDLYMLYLSPSGLRWVSIDPSVQRDFQSRRTTYSFEFEAGRAISSVFGDGGVYARPGVAIADDRPYEWNLEVGIRLNY